MAWDVFISHAIEDQAAARVLCTALEAAQITCWIAPRNITPGMTWPAAISAGIRESRFMLLIFSAHANRSHHIARELEIADRRRMVILPVRIEQLEPTGDIEYFLSNRQWIDVDARTLPERAESVLQAVNNLLPRTTDRSSPHVDQHEKESTRRASGTPISRSVPPPRVDVDAETPDENVRRAESRTADTTRAAAPKRKVKRTRKVADDVTDPTTVDESLPDSVLLPEDDAARSPAEQDVVTNNYRRMRIVVIWTIVIIGSVLAGMWIIASLSVHAAS